MPKIPLKCQLLFVFYIKQFYEFTSVVFVARFLVFSVKIITTIVNSVFNYFYQVAFRPSSSSSNTLYLLQKVNIYSSLSLRSFSTAFANGSASWSEGYVVTAWPHVPVGTFGHPTCFCLILL